MKISSRLKNTILYFLFGFTTLIFSGCVKQSDCDCGVKGKFVYEPYWSDAYNTTIKAHFIPDRDYASNIFKIEDFVPKDFRVSDTLYVSICYSSRETTPHKDDVRPLFKLKCIELAN